MSALLQCFPFFGLRSMPTRPKIAACSLMGNCCLCAGLAAKFWHCYWWSGEWGDGWVGRGDWASKKGALKPCEIVVIHLYVVGIVPLFFLHPFLTLLFFLSRSIFIFSSCRFDMHPEVSRGRSDIFGSLWLPTRTGRWISCSLRATLATLPSPRAFPTPSAAPWRKGMRISGNAPESSNVCLTYLQTACVPR